MSTLAVPFDKAATDETGGNPKVQRRHYLPAGSLPVIDQGQTEIAGYTGDLDLAYRGELPVVLFGDHTRALKYVDRPFALGADGVKVLQPRDGFSAKFLYYYWLASDIPNHGYSRHFKFLKDIAIPVFAPSEQRRIVEILDQADALRKLRREADAKAARILPALFLKMFGEPSKWKRTRPLGELVAMQSGGTPSKTVPEFWDGTIPWVSPKDMRRDEIADAEDHISDAALERSAIHMVPSDSILIVVRGMILAHDVPIAITRTPVTINQDMKALTLIDDQMTPLFLFAAMRAQTPRLHAEVTTAAHGTKRIETSRLASLPVLMPAQPDVDRFTSVYRNVLSVDKVRAAVAPKVEALFSTLLQHAFSGQLTAKWRQAHMQELLIEMQEQARLLNLPAPN